MTEIKIPFNKWSKERLEEGIKVCTSRSKVYGKVGDTFSVDGKCYLLMGVIQMPLWFVKKFLYGLEGARDSMEFEQVWRDIFRGEFNPDKLVWVHFFRETLK